MKRSAVIISVVFIASLLPGILHGAIPASERASLIALYNSTNGDNWTDNTGWKTAPLDTDGFAMPGTENTWYGVTCDSGNTTVERLLLYNNTLNGTIPAQLGNLANLIYLELFSNQLSGNIPTELGNLANLQSLRLNSNQLSGNIPTELANLANLQFLYLSSNQLSGNIPSELGNLANLQRLYLYSNQLTGNIPPELGNLTNLQSFTIGFNQISGNIPSELGNLSNLQRLYLYSNQLSGNIPSELGNLTNLQLFRLDSNQLTGNIPSELGNLTNIISLNLGHNQLTGNIPSELGNLTNLQLFRLDSNQLTGNIPSELGNLGNLQRLSLSSNQLSGNIPSELGNLANLQYLYLGSNQLVGSIPTTLTNLTNLLSISIVYNALYTNDGTLQSFLTTKNPGWENTQTIAPENVTTSLSDYYSIRVNWDTIAYTGHTGGYHVYYSTLSGGPYTWFGTTIDKNAFQMDVTGLNAGTTYYFMVQTQTNPHVVNQNTVVSENSAEVSDSTMPLLPPNVTTTAVSNITSTSATSGGNVTNEGSAAVTERGVCWSTSPNPTIADNLTTDGTGIGTFSSSLTGLSPGTTYHVRAYATNSVGTSYGSDVTFTTMAEVPKVTTTAVSNVTSTSAVGGGNVTSDGGAAVTARGVCWSTSPNPNKKDNKTADGKGNGSFTSNLTGLMENTTYYVRAYATNSAGTGYGNEVSFTTLAESLTVTITEPQDNAHVSGTVAIKATVTSTSNPANTSDALIQAVKKVEFYVDDAKIAEDTGEPYETTWDTTTYADGSHTVKAVAYNVANQTSKDEITVHVVNTPAEPPEIMLTRTHLNYGSVPQAGTASCSPNSANLTTGPQTILINNIGGGTLNWSVTKDADWLTYESETGIGPGIVTVSVDPSGLETGTYNATITIEDPNATNSPQTVPVALTVYNSGTTTIPFGYFETPADNSMVRSSIPVTGWVLDDIDITSVKIYRAHIPGHEPGSLVYIGDAVMVDGARPDVEQQFPTYPKDYQAGWGYMMLTNFLPNSGNGTFVLYAKATDMEGNQVTLGTKTITCDNANAVKPFGAIDTPTQGGTADGSSFTNWGWVLTPQPNSIPTDGSTIQVLVDSISIGNPTYNLYRADIAILFPGYANTNGAVGYFSLDTTVYSNGVHTISWIASDSGGNADGIGSRYFTIQNSGSSRSGSKIADNNQWKPIIKIEELSNLPFNYFEPIKIKKGYGRNIQSKIIQSDKENIFRIEIRELERMELHISNVEEGHMLEGNGIHPLPLGSTLDTKNGKFIWIPGPGFYGNYRMVFILKDPNGELSKQEILVSIVPKFGINK